MAIHTRMAVVLSLTQAIVGTSNAVSSNYWVGGSGQNARVHQIIATGQHFSVVLFIMMYKVFLQMKPLGVIFSVSSTFLRYCSLCCTRWF